MKKEKNLCVEILNYFQVSSNVTVDSLTKFKVFKSDKYGLGPVYGFYLNREHFYICSDYSIDNNLNYLEEILKGINHLVKGHAVADPNSTPNEKNYAYAIDDDEYYLWRAEG